MKTIVTVLWLVCYLLAGCSPIQMVPEEYQLDVPLLSQYPELPTGCEVTAATMALQYYDEDIQPTEVAANWLECQYPYMKNGTLYGPDPHQVFVGNPFESNSYGCYAPVIAQMIQDHSRLCRAQLVSVTDLETLCDTYICKDKPVLIWVTMEMKASQEGNRWQLKNGETFTWIAGEHCVVLTGYDATYYYLNDPMTGQLEKYPKALVQRRYEELGCQAVMIEDQKKTSRS